MHFLQEITRCPYDLKVHRLVSPISIHVPFCGILYPYFMNGVTDADNIGASGRHWNGMGGGEAPLRYQRPIYGINSIRNRRGKAFRQLNDQSAVSSIDLVFSSIVRLRCFYPRWELVRLYDIGKVTPTESLTVLLARTNGDIHRYVVGGKAMKRSFSRIDPHRMFCTNRRSG